MSYGWQRGGRYGYAKAGVPVDRSYKGVLSALKAELPPDTSVRVLAAKERASGVYSVTIDASSAEKLQGKLEGWLAHGPMILLRTRGGNSVYLPAWTGTVQVMDHELRELVLVDVMGRPLSDDSIRADQPDRDYYEPGDFKKMYLGEPDYHGRLRYWLEERILDGAPLPGKFFEFETRGFVREPRNLDLSGHTSQDAALRPAQAKAVERAGRPVSVVWGPPGTGKTFTLGSMVAGLVRAGEKVLVVCHTNVAADTAALAIDDAFRRIGYDLSPGFLVRTGRPTLDALLQRRHLMAWTDKLAEYNDNIRQLMAAMSILEKAKAMIAQNQDLTQEERDELRSKINVKLALLKKDLQKVQRSRANKMREMALDAKIIVSTILSAISGTVVLDAFEDDPGALVFDEASMVSAYALVPFLEYEWNRIVIAGDFNQLPPIRRNDNALDKNSEFWIERSLFDVLGVSDNATAEAMEKQGVLTLLDTQSRMHPDICDVISMQFYGGRLQTTSPPSPPPLLPGWPDSPFVEISKATPAPPFAPDGVSGRIKDKKCEKTAWIAVGLAKALLEQDPDATVMLLTPFRKQALLLETLVKAHLSSFEGRVVSGTVHRSQGQEADLVIFDLVWPNSLVDGGFQGETGRKLVNVALSRAKRQVFLMGPESSIFEVPALQGVDSLADMWKVDWAAIGLTS